MMQLKAILHPLVSLRGTPKMGLRMAQACLKMALSQINSEPELRVKTGHGQPMRSSGVLQRRRLISFRLSEDEYAGLKRLCDEHGARSLSDFVRANVCIMLNAPKAWEEDVEITVREFGRQALQLNGLVDQLGYLLRTTPGRAK
jgi:hypothetical protein